MVSQEQIQRALHNVESSIAPPNSPENLYIDLWHTTKVRYYSDGRIKLLSSWSRPAKEQNIVKKEKPKKVEYSIENEGEVLL